MGGNSSPHYRTLHLSADAERRPEAKRRREEKNASGAQRKNGNRRKRREELTRYTTCLELLCHFYTVFSLPLQAGTTSRSTIGKIPLPTGKCCPLRLNPETDCGFRQQEIYYSVRTYLEPPGEAATQRFSPRRALEDLGQQSKPISNQQDLESYEGFCVESYVRDTIAQFCEIPAARGKFHLVHRSYRYPRKRTVMFPTLEAKA
ncbi:hypothetical protein BDV27DRAFT_145443 [Aspergillus caelatus]|uniref:Uncharacterized protein n=1 Tax=Aspergillus caelatus TaxID=61420 RepID=A0A5N7A530_9EURO|nr:uncharacterized protein BDV27DRAFT_145443 [Aspergillus caelatus]KAE8364289.1 hypothetical protein BDV27DRAFT_145443 [Aspergillus caelatus]